MTLPTSPSPTILETRSLVFKYGDVTALAGIDLAIPEKRITAIIGPSGCGKSTLIRVFNRMNDFIPGVSIEGQVLYRDQDLYGRGVDPVEIRRQIGMVFQRPNPFPKTILANVTWGPRINGYTGDLLELAERALKQAALWEEVKDRLSDNALRLSGGQQQRLCIARAIAMEPEVILFDEPCSALDPISTSRIEELLDELRERYTLVMVTHNMQQAARASDFTAFLYQGSLVEFGPTKDIFQRPKNRQTQDYVTGRFG